MTNVTSFLELSSDGICHDAKLNYFCLLSGKRSCRSQGTSPYHSNLWNFEGFWRRNWSRRWNRCLSQSRNHATSRAAHDLPQVKAKVEAEGAEGYWVMEAEARILGTKKLPSGLRSAWSWNLSWHEELELDQEQETQSELLTCLWDELELEQLAAPSKFFISQKFK